MSKAKDLVGNVYGHLKVLEYSHVSNKSHYWKCVCDCGNTTIVQRSNLVSGKTKSCGCKKNVRKFEDLSGRKYGRYTIIRRVENRQTSIMWECRCDCGSIKNVEGSKLKSGEIVSCGCYGNERRIERATKHNDSRTRLYKSWIGMKQRCYQKKGSDYQNYGGRGITVCDEWKNDFMSFKTWAMQNGYSDNLTLDRIDVNSSYCPENCRWITMKEQNRNKTNTVYIEYNGKNYTRCELADMYNLSPGQLSARLNIGWTLERALKTPLYGDR